MKRILQTIFFCGIYIFSYSQDCKFWPVFNSTTRTASIPFGKSVTFTYSNLSKLIGPRPYDVIIPSNYFTPDPGITTAAPPNSTEHNVTDRGVFSIFPVASGETGSIIFNSATTTGFYLHIVQIVSRIDFDHPFTLISSDGQISVSGNSIIPTVGAGQSSDDANATIFFNPGITTIHFILTDLTGSTIDGIGFAFTFPDNCIATFFQDADGDGFGNPNSPSFATTQPPGYVTDNSDCNDNEHTVYPGAPELCDGKDNNCNGQTDENILIIFYRDADGDGFGSTANTIQSCSQTLGYTAASGDCDDNDNTVYPDAPELCDGKDNNCNGQTDENILLIFYRDVDGDGFGSTANTTQACSPPVGYTAGSGDCDDNDNTVYPGATELCDGKDNNCNNRTDDAIVMTTFYQDADGDSYGNTGVTVQACSQPAGYVLQDGDCNDNNLAIHPGATEICNALDDNCNGQIDEGIVTTIYYRDADSDGYGNPAITVQRCSPPAGYVLNNTDCDDNNSALNIPIVNTQATWVSGDNTINQSGVYGVKGVASSSLKPGSRYSSISWTDLSGNLWLMGGVAPNSLGLMNDLWKYNPSTELWTWVSGDNSFNQPGVYGTKGIPSSANTPGARYSAVSWTDPAGNLWLMGGHGYTTASIQGLLNDLWKFNPATNEWTWVSGNNTVNPAAVYGTKGVSRVTNKPGARRDGLSWTDAVGNLWLMGGHGLTTSSAEGALNDLWKFNPSTNQWTWIGGDNSRNQFGVYGTIRVPRASNKPGSRRDAVSWTDPIGNLWLMGGYGFGANGNQGALNDLWKFNISSNQWTWVSGDKNINQSGVYGTKGIASSLVKPGARSSAVSWIDAVGNLWLMGGEIPFSTSLRLMNDLWKFDPSTNEWTWVNGANIPNQMSVFGTKGLTSSSNNPGARYSAISWKDPSGNYWLMSGLQVNFSAVGFMNDLWRFNPSSNEWSWMSGDVGYNALGIYVAPGTPSPSLKPGARAGAISWTDPAGNLWLMGGATFNANAFTLMSDLWKYNPSTNMWTWINGSNKPNQPAIYGTQGIGHANNHPGARSGAVSWTDLAGNLWLMGGTVPFANWLLHKNDLWKYDPSTNEWTWVNGAKDPGQLSNYGTKGLASSLNCPGARSGAVSWTDPAGNLWLMGGLGYASTTSNGMLNDLWKFNPSTNQWTWVNGDKITNQGSVYGTKGAASFSNKPGARSGAVSWTDRSGNLWLMGGVFSGIYNDLWKFNPSTKLWTWMSGDASSNQFGNYGIKGTASLLNKPGGRYGAVSWIDSRDNLWIMGGSGYASNSPGFLNDMWKFEVLTNEWTWVSGDSGVNNSGVYGKIGVTVVANKPGARSGAVRWIDGAGNLWLMGGGGYAGSSFGYLNDLWKYEVVSNQCATPTTASIKSKAITVVTEQPAIGIALHAFPNPSGNYFILRIKSDTKAPLTLRVIDQYGRLIEDKSIQGNRNVQLGSSYRPGVYYVELRQQTEKVIVKLIKY